MENPRQKSMTLLLSFERSAGPFMPQVEENSLDPLLRRYLLLDTCKDVSNNKKNQAWKSENRQGWLTARSFWLFSFENLIEFFCFVLSILCRMSVDNRPFLKLRHWARSFTLRPCLHVSGFVCIRRRFIAVTKLYASTRIRICCVFDRPHVSEFDTQVRVGYWACVDE